MHGSSFPQAWGRLRAGTKGKAHLVAADVNLHIIWVATASLADAECEAQHVLEISLAALERNRAASIDVGAFGGAARWAICGEESIKFNGA